MPKTALRFPQVENTDAYFLGGWGFGLGLSRAMVIRRAVNVSPVSGSLKRIACS